MGILTLLRNAFGRSRKDRTAEEPSRETPTTTEAPVTAAAPEPATTAPEPTGPTAPAKVPAQSTGRTDEHDLVAAAFDNVTVPRQGTPQEEAQEATAEPEAKAAEVPEPEAEPVAEVTPEPEPQAEEISQPEPEAAEVPEPEPMAEVTPEPVAEVTPEPEPVADAAPEPEAEPVAEAAPEPEPEPLAEAAPEPEPVTIEEPAPTNEPAPAEGEAQATPEPGPKPEADATPEPQPEPEAEAKPALTLARVKSRAPGLTTAYKAAATALKTRNLTGTRAKVYLVLDRSASMRPYYKDGSAQALGEQVLALAAHLDPEATVPVVFFSTELDGTGELTLTDHENKIDELHSALGRMGRTSYHVAVEAVIAHHEKSQDPTAPALVIFQTDGAPDAKTPATQALTNAAKNHPALFFSFVAFGDPENKAFDYLRKLKTDNTSAFLAGETPRELTDTEIYEGVLANWRP